MKKIITLFLEFRSKFLGFIRKPNEASGNGKHLKFSSSADPGVLLILKNFQNVPYVQKSNGAQVYSTTSSQNKCRLLVVKTQEAGCLKKLVSGTLERDESIQ